MSDAARSDNEFSDSDLIHDTASQTPAEAEDAAAGEPAGAEHSDHDPAPDAAAPRRVPAPLAERAAPVQGRLIPIYSPIADEDRFFADAGRSHRGARADGPAPAAKVRGRRDWRRLRAAASLAAVVAIGAAAAAEHLHALRVERVAQAHTQTLAQRFDAMATRLGSLESNRSRDELASLRKVLAEIKSGAAGARDLNGAVGQLTSRVERLEKEQSARLDKLGDRIDRDAAARLTDITARLDKLEAKVAAPAVATAPAKAAAAAKSVAAKTAPAVSYETTGAVDPPPRLHRFWLAEIHNGYAMIDSPAGEFAVAPGDVVPGGGGRVLRIERHGRDWVVLTTHGEIVAADD